MSEPKQLIASLTATIHGNEDGKVIESVMFVRGLNIRFLATEANGLWSLALDGIPQGAFDILGSKEFSEAVAVMLAGFNSGMGNQNTKETL